MRDGGKGVAQGETYVRLSTSPQTKPAQPEPSTPLGESDERANRSESMKGKLPSGPNTRHSIARPLRFKSSNAGGTVS
eukprot:5354212-Prymnesium_polylepis.5